MMAANIKRAGNLSKALITIGSEKTNRKDAWRPSGRRTGVAHCGKREGHDERLRIKDERLPRSGRYAKEKDKTHGSLQSARLAVAHRTSSRQNRSTKYTN